MCLPRKTHRPITECAYQDNTVKWQVGYFMVSQEKALNNCFIACHRRHGDRHKSVEYIYMQRTMGRLGAWNTVEYTTAFEFLVFWLAAFCKVGMNRDIAFFSQQLSTLTSSNFLILFPLVFRAHSWNQSKYKDVDRPLVQGNSHTNDLHCETKRLWKEAVTCELNPGGWETPI